MIDHLSLGVSNARPRDRVLRRGARAARGPGYYAALVRDLDGYKLEAVCHER